MIIGCQKCNKKFEINSNLIPKDGRLLKCGSCDHEWFFTAQIIEKINPENDQINNKSNNIPTSIKKEELEISPKKIEKEELEIVPNLIENNLNDHQSKEIPKFKKKNNIKFFNILIISIISIVSIILIADTFKKPISIVIPNIEHLLYNLYESLKDIKSFFINLNQ